MKTLLLIRLAGYDTFVVVTWIVQRNIQIATRHMQCHLKMNDHALNRLANHSGIMHFSRKRNYWRNCFVRELV